MSDTSDSNLAAQPHSLRNPPVASMMEMDYDQYQRYSTLAEIVDLLLRGESGPFRILEVGSNVIDRLPIFLDKHRVSVVRCDVVADPKDPNFVVLTLGAPLPFADKSFDVVVAAEVLEHVEPNQREKFLSECVRVARVGSVFTCPNDHPEVPVYEQLFSDLYRYYHGTPHPWIQEHRIFGIPESASIVAMLERAGQRVRTFENSPLDIWLPMAMLYTHLCGDIDAYQAELNSTLTSNRLLARPIYYRKIFVAAPNEAALENLKEFKGNGTSVLDPRDLDARSVLMSNAALPGLTAVNALQAHLHAVQARLHALLAAYDADQAKQKALIARNELLLEQSSFYIRNIETALASNKAEAARTIAHYELADRIKSRMLERVTKSAAWKLTGGLRYAKALIKPPKCGLDPSLRTGDIVPDAGGPGHWLATRDDPQFYNPGPFRKGWLRINLIVTGPEFMFCQFFFDRGNGYSEKDSFQLQSVGGRIEHDFYYPVDTAIRSIRFDPISEMGPFTIERFELESVPGPRLAIRALRKRVGQIGVVKALLNWTTACLTFNSKRLKNDVYGAIKFFPLSRTYADWFADTRRDLDKQRDALRAQVEQMPRRPLISVLTPVFNVPETYLTQCVDSVCRQIYPNWELILVDDCSTAAHIRPALESYRKKDPRIKVVYREENGNISEASNTALQHAAGEYVALLDNDDMLADDALFLVAQALAADPAIDWIYTDEDKIDTENAHSEPFFKPDWSPEYHLAVMYTCHLGVYRTSLVLDLGGFRKEFDGAQDYDLTLRLMARNAKIKHIPKILYHWRTLPSSTAASLGAKPLAWQRGLAALNRHLQETKQEGEAKFADSPGTYSVRYTIRDNPLVSIIIPSTCSTVEIDGKKVSMLRTCIASIFAKSTYRNFEILVADRNQMPPEMEAEFTALGVRRVNYDFPFNWSHVNNVAAKNARGQQLLFMNDDMEVISGDWLEAMVSFSQVAGVGAVGAKLVYPDGKIQHAGVTLMRGLPHHHHMGFGGERPGYFNCLVLHRNYAAVTGACLMTRRDVFDAIGGFNENFPLNYNDIDYCLRVLKRSFRVVYTPYAKVTHFESMTRSKAVLDSEIARFKELWPEFQEDPYYNPNLTHWRCDYSMDI